MFQDARDYQILFLSVFLVLGLGTRDWTLKPELMLVIISSCLLTQWVMTCLIPYLSRNSLQTQIQGKIANPKLFALSPLKSAIITSLGLCLLLRANEPQTMATAGCLAILSKFLFRRHGKHFFNPANFGIIIALVFTQDAWVSPGQWGTDWWYLLLFLGTGGMVLQRVGRWDTSAVFLVSYTALEALRNYWLGWNWDVLLHQLMSGSFLLFALFMLTDPRSIPDARIGRIIWALALAWSAFILRDYFYLSTAMFWALFALSPLTLVLDSLWSGSRFRWQKLSPDV